MAQSNQDEQGQRLGNLPRAASKDDIDKAADGNPRAWLLVAGSFFMVFNTWGIINSFGAYQEYYSSALLNNSSASLISWIGTIQGFLMEFMGLFIGPVFDSGYFHSLIYAGSVFVVLGTMALSICNNYWQVFLAQGLCIGLGTGMVFVPSVSVVTTAFNRRRAIAIGIVSSASSLALTTFSISFAAYHSYRVKSRTRRSLIDTEALREPAFMVYIPAFLTLCCGYFVPLFYIPSYAISHLRTSDDMAFYLLALTNAGSLIGRLLPGLLPQWLARVEAFPVATTATGLIVLLWLQVNNLGGFVAFCVIYGLSSGILITLATIMVPLLAPPGIVETRIGTRLGMSYFGAGIGVLIGSPIAGALTDTSKGDFVGAQGWGGATLLAGAALLIYPWLFVRR
ncbi:MAG: hypothetical protein L6R38_002365 [Xanthoria sp. 2 TBL-2021]|nr:MAG: hypothetical protein L6R38_002365 [Xanthoria sp. 2 TBL-2021]